MKKLALVFLSLAFTLSASAFADEQETKKDSFSMGESSLASFDMAYAEATKPCPREGEIGMSLKGLILSCQSGDWQLQAGKGEFYPDGGYVELPNGFAMQWGKSWNNGTPAGEYTVLNRPFKTACMSIVSTADGENTMAADGVNTWGCDKNGFMANLFYFTGDYPRTTQGWVYWTAYGY